MSNLELTADSFKNYVSSNINDDNFLLFQALLNLSDKEQQLAIFDALLNNYISINDIASLKSFSKDEIDQFIQKFITYSKQVIEPTQSPQALFSLNELLNTLGYGVQVLEVDTVLKSKDRAFKLNVNHHILSKYNPQLNNLIAECADQADIKSTTTWEDLWVAPTSSHAATLNWFNALYKPILSASSINDALLNIDNVHSIIQREVPLSRYLFTFKRPLFLKQIIWPLANELNGATLTASVVTSKINALLQVRFTADEYILNPEYFVNKLLFWKSAAEKLNLNASTYTELSYAITFLLSAQAKQEKWLNYFYQEVRKKIVSSFPYGYENELPFAGA